MYIYIFLRTRNRKRILRCHARTRHFLSTTKTGKPIIMSDTPTKAPLIDEPTALFALSVRAIAFHSAL